MRNFITPEEIEQYRQLREEGLTVRQAAAIIGRAHSALHKFDLHRKSRSKAPELELAITMPIEEALSEALALQADEAFATATRVEEIPTLRSKIRRLVSTVLKIIGASNRRSA